MDARIETIRNNIYRKYSEEYLRQILINFHMQQLDIQNFVIENRNISKVLNHYLIAWII